MDKIQSYKDAVMDLKQQYLNDPDSDIDQKLNEVIYAAVRLYQDEDISFLVPVSHGNLVVYDEDHKYYLPLYTDKSESKATIIDSYIEAGLPETIGYVNDIVEKKQILENPQYAIEHAIDYDTIKRFFENNPKLEGIVIDSDSPHYFFFDGWFLSALYMLGSGVNEFSVHDPETGEVSHILKMQ